MNLIFFLLFYFNFIQANLINPTTNITTNQTVPVPDVLIVLSDEKNSSISSNKTDDLLNALPSVSTLTKLTLTSDNKIKTNKNSEIHSEVRNDFIHKSIPIQRGIIKSRPLAGVKASSYQLNEQLKDVKSDTLDDLSTERSTMIASTRTAPLSVSTSSIASSSTTKNLLTSNSNQFKQLASSLPNSSLAALSSETSDLLMRRSTLSKTNFNSEKTNNQDKKFLKQQLPMKKSNTADHYETQQEDQIDNQELHKDDPYLKNFPDIQSKELDESKQLVPSNEHHVNNREICDFCLYDGEGNFTSYGYPLPYKANLNCSYRVQRIDEYETCALEIIFHEFDVPIEAETTSSLVLGTKKKIDESASNECTGDYLEIQGRKFCGNGWTNKIETIPFAPEKTELSFRFHSDKKGSGKGFWLEVKRKLGSCYGRVLQNKKCEKRFSEMNFSMTSPQFPTTYANNLNCIYFVRKATPDVCGLELRFAHFDVESVNGCFYDFLEIKEEKLCGTMRSNTIKKLKFAADEDQKQFTFHSDKQVGRSGFRIEVSQLTNCESIFDDDVNLDDSKVEQLPPPPSCNICTSEKHGTLTSYGYPMNYRNNLHCSYTIDKNNDAYCGLQLQFDDFNVAPSMGCEEDYLQINDEKFCGTTLHSTKKLITFKTINNSSNKNQDEKTNENQYSHFANNSVQMVFHTNQAQTSKGFSITFQQIKCNNLEEDDDKNKINLSNENDNTARYSENKDQDDNSDLSNQMTTSTPSPISNCEYSFNEKTFTLTSPNSSINDEKNPTYPNNLACDYKIVQNSSRVCYLELKFIVFDVEASEKCQYDYLEVNNVRLCGTLQRQTTRTYIFNTYDKVIRFRTDGSTSRSGFFIDVEQLECIGDAIIRPSLPSLLNITNSVNKNQDKTNYGTKNSISINKYPMLPTKSPGYSMNTVKNNTNDLCVESFNNEEFDIFSPNFPVSYPVNSFCVYTVNRFSPNICKLEIKFMQFNIENSKSEVCSADYLDIMGQKVCGSLGSGTLKQFDFPEDRNSLRIVFSANSLNSDNDLGFYLRAKQVSCISNEQNLILHQNPITKTNMNHHIPNPLFSDNNLNGNCNEIHTESVFQLKSPNFPSSYVRNLNCIYKIIKKNPEVCSLEVHVLEFNVQPSLNKQSTSMMQKKNCGNEYLEFNGETICGRISPRAIRFFSFDNNEFIIKFKSGYTDLDNIDEKMGRAFLLQIRQKECSSLSENKNFEFNNPNMNPPINSVKGYEGTKTKISQKPHMTISNNFDKIKQIENCDQSFNSQEFEIKYSIPLQKESIENETKVCAYTINKYMPTICALKLAFNDIHQADLSQMNNCDLNYLQITENEKLCFDSSSKEKKIPFDENVKMIKLFLNTRSENPQRVFIKVNQIDCLPGENSITQQNTHMYPNTFNDQQNNLEMPNQESFVVQNSDKNMNTPVDSEDKTNLIFNDKPFDTTNFSMNTDLEIQKHQQNVLNNETDLNQKHVSSVTIENDYLSQLPPPSICELCYTELNGEIISYNYPAVYPKNLNCNYKITGQPNFCGVYLRFDVFTINNADTKSSLSPCVDDYLELNSVRYCGKQLENVKKILAFENSPKELSFRFISKKHTIGNGFKLNYMQIPCYLTPGQQSILNAMMTDYPSPSMTNPQTSSTSSISKQSFSKTNLMSNSMSKNTDLSHENQVQAQENEMKTDYQTFYSLSADPNPLSQKQNLPLIKANYSLEKNSNDLNQASSFYSVPRLPCDQAIYDRFFEIRSPSYPFSYQSNLDCLYSIRRLSSNICKLRLYFVHFDLENDHNYKLIKDNHSLQRSLLHETETCNEDYLEINEKIRFCGTNLNGTLRDFDFTSYKFPLRFRSNEEGSGRGFLIRGEQIRCIPSSFMFLNLENKQNNNQLVSSDSTLSTQESNNDNFNSNSGLDQTILMQKFYQMPSVSKNSTSYSSSSSATFQSPKQTSSTNSSFSNHLSNSISQSTSLNATESLNLLNPNKNEFTNEFNSMNNSPFQWSIPNPPYTVSIKGQQVSINQYSNNEMKNNLNRNNYDSTIPFNKMSTLNDTQDIKQPVAADSQHTSSSISQYNCNQIISDSVFELTSPYYPYRYDSNTRCLITIQKFKRNVCHLDLIFIKFDLGSTSNCESYTDYLSVNEERFCGHYYSNRSYHFTTPDDVDRAVKVRTFRFDGPTLQMRFNGEIGTGYGFYLRGKQVECAVVGTDYMGRISEVVDTHHNADMHHHDKIDNHHDNHYDPHIHDHIVTVNHHSKIHDDNQHNLHHDNHHIVRDNEHPSHLLHHTLDRPAYHYHPDQYYSNLHKDNLTNFDHKSNTGYLNKGLNNTQHASNQTIHLRLDNKVLQHQDLNNTTNHYNYPPRVNLHHLTNNYQSNKNQHSNFTTNNLTKHHHLQNNYNTNNYQTNNKANHDTRYNVSNYLIDSNSLVGVPKSLSSLSHCDQIFSTNVFQIQSSNYPANYPNNIYCRYVIKRPNNATCAIDLTFVHFNLEEEDRCSKDYFEIDGAKICGSLPPYHQRRYYYFNGENEKILVFRSDLFISQSGYSIIGQQVTNCNSYSTKIDNSPIRCDVNTDAVKGELVSRNYPAPYDHNMQCTYKIRAADQRFCRLSLRIRDFDIKSNANCDDDYLYIDGERLCNSNLKKSEMTLYFPENNVARELQFNFYTNSIESGRGFYIEYLQELCIGDNNLKYQTNIGYMYPNQAENSEKKQFNQGRSINSEITNDDELRQQTISLREQKDKINKNSPPTYPPNYVARSNPVGEMIEATDINHQNEDLNNQTNLSNTNNFLDYHKRNHINHNALQNESINRKMPSDKNFYSSSDNKSNSNSKMNYWAGNTILMKPTTSSESFISKLKMGDQVLTSVKGKYEVIENKANKA